LSKNRHAPNVTTATEALAAEKRDRLAAELRANLARRKAQIRERSAAADVTQMPPGKDDAPA
jgi:hypothetical protein